MVGSSLIFNVPPPCPLDRPILPNSHLPKQNQADRGMTKIIVNPNQVGDHLYSYTISFHSVRRDPTPRKTTSSPTAAAAATAFPPTRPPPSASSGRCAAASSRRSTLSTQACGRRRSARGSASRPTTGRGESTRKCEFISFRLQPGGEIHATSLREICTTE